MQWLRHQCHSRCSSRSICQTILWLRSAHMDCQKIVLSLSSKCKDTLWSIRFSSSLRLLESAAIWKVLSDTRHHEITERPFHQSKGPPWSFCQVLANNRSIYGIRTKCPRIWADQRAYWHGYLSLTWAHFTRVTQWSWPATCLSSHLWDHQKARPQQDSVFWAKCSWLFLWGIQWQPWEWEGNK